MNDLSIWSHALAAAFFGAIAIGQLQRDLRDRRDLAMAVALALTGLFALGVATSSPYSRLVLLAEHLKDFGWIAFLYLVWRKGSTGHVRTIGWVYAVIAAVLCLQMGYDLLGHFEVLGVVGNLPIEALAVLRMAVSIGSLLMVHNLYTAAQDDARDALRLPMIGITLIWIYDLNLATTAWLSGGWPDMLFAHKGLLLCFVAPLFALAAYRQPNWQIKFSRSMTLQTVNLASIGLYLIAMVLIVQLLEMLGGERARLAQVSFIFASFLAGLILIPSAKFKGWLRVMLAKHVFKHRYDYRLEWQRFTNTLGSADADPTPIPTRAVKALADMLEAEGGLLIADGAGGMIIDTALNWELPSIDPPCIKPAFAAHLVRTGRIIDLELVRRGKSSDVNDQLAPDWMLADPRAWVAIPLVHFERLMGIVVLAHPPISRALDWEDFDLMRVAGSQVASYLAEAKGQQEIADMRRFDEFNRRFAFIMHDIKNLASQLGLLAHNAERHAENPEFRADMIETLKNSTARMNDLLARLSQHNKGRREEARPVIACDICKRVATARRGSHRLIVAGDCDVRILADPARLEQALGQLVQNAIEASPIDEAIQLVVTHESPMIRIDVIDKGCGMSPNFIHNQLFKPFVSTKATGFGIGSFEARALITGMGGRLDVESNEGQGTRFSIRLPEVQVEPDLVEEEFAA